MRADQRPDLRNSRVALFNAYETVCRRLLTKSTHSVGGAARALQPPVVA